jgi:hypothetical protein
MADINATCTPAGVRDIERRLSVDIRTVTGGWLPL